MDEYSSVDLTRVVHAFVFTFCEHLFRFRLISPRVLTVLRLYVIYVGFPSKASL